MSYIHNNFTPSRFQSTHPHGVRLNASTFSRTAPLFQSTHPHGVRRLTLQARILAESFNPRTHTGCDRARSVLCNSKPCVSIHAPTRGATMLDSANIIYIYGFNPRTHTGCDAFVQVHWQQYRVSIHAPTRGATCWRFKRRP